MPELVREEQCIKCNGTGKRISGWRLLMQPILGGTLVILGLLSLWSVGSNLKSWVFIILGICTCVDVMKECPACGGKGKIELRERTVETTGVSTGK